MDQRLSRNCGMAVSNGAPRRFRASALLYNTWARSLIGGQLCGGLLIIIIKSLWHFRASEEAFIQVVEVFATTSRKNLETDVPW